MNGPLACLHCGRPAAFTESVPVCAACVAERVSWAWRPDRLPAALVASLEAWHPVSLGLALDRRGDLVRAWRWRGEAAR